MLLVINDLPEVVDPRTLVHPSRQQGVDGTTFTGDRRRRQQETGVNWAIVRERLSISLADLLTMMPLTSA